MRLIKLSSILLLLFFISCSDKEYDDVIDSEIQETNTPSVSEMAIERAQEIFYHGNVDISPTATYDINELTKSECWSNIPYWYQGNDVGLVDGGTVSVVPLVMPKEYNKVGIGAQLLFFDDDSCDQPYTFIWYHSTSAHVDGRPTKISNDDFTGYVYTQNYCTGIISAYELLEGVFIKQHELIDDEFTCSTAYTEKGFFQWLARLLGFGCDEVACPNNISDRKEGFFQRIGSKLAEIFGSGDANEPHTIVFRFWTGTTSGGGATGGDGGGGITHAHINQFFNDPLFNGEGLSVHNNLTRIISDNNLDMCPNELHGLLHNCLRNQYESSIDDVGFGGGPSQGADIDPIDFSMDHYLRLLDDEEFVSACLIGEGISYSDEDISEEDVEVICAIKQFFPDNEVNEILNIINSKCGPTSGDVCKFTQLYCLDRLRGFKERYGIEMSYAELSEIAGGACHASDEEFDETVVEMLNNNDPDLIIDCNSFNFVQRVGGNLWACGVSHINTDFYYFTNVRSGYVTLNHVLYFQVARKNFPGNINERGDVMRTCALAVIAAEEEIEDYYSNTVFTHPIPVALGTEIRRKFKEFVEDNINLVYQGSRVTFDNPNSVPKNQAQYLDFFMGDCN